LTGWFLVLLHQFSCNFWTLILSPNTIDAHRPYFQFSLILSESRVRFRVTAIQFLLATSTLRPTTRIFIFQLNTCGYSPYVTCSLARGWVCSLQSLLVLSSAVTHKFESRGAHDHILLFQIRDSPNMEGQVPVFIFPRKRVARLYPQTLDFSV
jgi:hypothetical protein